MVKDLRTARVWLETVLSVDSLFVRKNITPLIKAIFGEEVGMFIDLKKLQIWTKQPKMRMTQYVKIEVDQIYLKKSVLPEEFAEEYKYGYKFEMWIEYGADNQDEIEIGFEALCSPGLIESGQKLTGKTSFKNIVKVSDILSRTEYQKETILAECMVKIEEAGRVVLREFREDLSEEQKLWEKQRTRSAA